MNLNTVNEKNIDTQINLEQEQVIDSRIVDKNIPIEKNDSLGNISIENATYLQNTENSDERDQTTSFEVDSIELETPQLFSNDQDFPNNESQEQNELEIFEKEKTTEISNTEEPEMFENSEIEEDFEIPAFLRRQKN